MGFEQNSLISYIYELALGRATWDNVLDLLSASFPDSLILVMGHDLKTRASIAFSQRGLSAAAVSAYLCSYAKQNPWIGGHIEMPLYQVYHDEQLIDRNTAQASGFYRDWLSKQGDYSGGTGAVILREGTRQLSIEIRYSEADLEVRERAAAVLGEASYHFGRAFEILRRSRFSAGQSYLETVVEDLPFAMFFVDQELRIHYSNQHAESLRRTGGGPFVGVDGILRAADEKTDAQLRELVYKLAQSKRFPTSALQLGEPGRDEKYFVIAKLASRRLQNYQLHDVILDTGPLVMLVVHGALDATSVPIELLLRSFGLTDSEAHLAEALLNGATLADFAQAREVSKQTLRNQLVGVMRKTGTRRQSELVSLLTRLAMTCL